MGERGTVTIHGMKPKKSLVRYVQKQVEKWLSEPTLSDPPEYQVEIDKYREACVECSLVVRAKQGEWRIQEWGNSIPDALSRGLRHLRSVCQNMPPTPPRQLNTI